MTHRSQAVLRSQSSTYITRGGEGFHLCNAPALASVRSRFDCEMVAIKHRIATISQAKQTTAPSDGASQADIARELGVSRQAIQKMLAV
jgi:hypothetical protein